MERQINREALRITRMGDRKSTSKSGYDASKMFWDQDDHEFIFNQLIWPNSIRFKMIIDRLIVCWSYKSA